MNSRSTRLTALLVGLACLFATMSCGRKPLGKANAPSDAPQPEAPAATAAAEEVSAVPTTPPPPPPEPDTPEEAVDTTASVSILGYHEFTEKSSGAKAMRIPIETFRRQMQSLKDNEIPVISLSDFLAWRRGEKNIPPFSVIITIDDGWKSTRTMAFPVLQEFGYPFTVYLYTNYVDIGGGGRSLSLKEIKELLAGGGELGSHGISHKNMRQMRGRSEADYAAFLKRETEEARKRLFEKVGVDPVTFSYPYGAYNDRVIQACVDAKYEAMVTVAGKKVGWNTDLKELGRYIVHGKDDRLFKMAISTNAPGGFGGGKNLVQETVKDEVTGDEKPLIVVTPTDGATVRIRQPFIEADFSSLGKIEPKSLKMYVSGVGEVIPDYDAETLKISYKPNQRLRLPDYWVRVQFKREGSKKSESLRWRFNVDLLASYLKEADSTPLPPNGPSEESATTPVAAKES